MSSLSTILGTIDVGPASGASFSLSVIVAFVSSAVGSSDNGAIKVVDSFVVVEDVSITSDVFGTSETDEIVNVDDSVGCDDVCCNDVVGEDVVGDEIVVVVVVVSVVDVVVCVVVVSVVDVVVVVVVGSQRLEDALTR